jgi:hypothetical protein
LDGLLLGLGLRLQHWSFDVRITQATLRDWYKIPVVSRGLLSTISARERRRRIDAAFERSDAESWRFERWAGWTAWKAHAAT